MISCPLLPALGVGEGGNGVTSCFVMCKRLIFISMEPQTLDVIWFGFEKGDADADQAYQVGGRQE